MNIERLRSILADPRFKRKDVILKSGVSGTTFDKLLEGRDARISTLEAIASAIGVSPAIFFEEADNSQSDGTLLNLSVLNAENARLIEEKTELKNEVNQLKSELLRTKDELLSAQAKIIKLLGDE